MHRRDGRQEPGDRHREGGPRGGGRGDRRSAFGFGGQKCSANSRVYVERRGPRRVRAAARQKTEKITIGDPLDRANWLGPVIDERRGGALQEAVAEARRDGRVVTGGERLTDGDLARGNFVEPTVVGSLPADHRLFQDELFVPFIAVRAVDSLDEALRLANDSVYGLTAGVYSEDPAEVERFLDEIEAGVLYVNRAAGATTGAWPGVQPFGGWKGSGHDRQGGSRHRTTRPSSCASRATRSSTDGSSPARTVMPDGPVLERRRRPRRARPFGYTRPIHSA